VSDFDTGDEVRDKPTGIKYTVACVHETHGYGVVYTAGVPSRTLRMSDCELVTKASPAERLESLKAMAAVKSEQHRPQCARDRLKAMEPVSYDSGCC